MALGRLFKIVCMIMYIYCIFTIGDLSFRSVSGKTRFLRNISGAVGKHIPVLPVLLTPSEGAK